MELQVTLTSSVYTYYNADIALSIRYYNAGIAYHVTRNKTLYTHGAQVYVNGIQ